MLCYVMSVLWLWYVVCVIVMFLFFMLYVMPVFWSFVIFCVMLLLCYDSWSNREMCMIRSRSSIFGSDLKSEGFFIKPDEAFPPGSYWPHLTS